VTSLIREPERARRLARVLVSDIVAYAGDEVRMGLEKDDLFDRLHADIARARDYFLRRVAPELRESDRIFDWALVDVLVGSQRRVRTHIW
jgi:hypothetical protein